MLHAYQSPPLFIDDVQQPLGAADLNVLRNNAVLLDAASFTSSPATQSSAGKDTSTPGYYVGVAGERIWWGSFQFFVGMTTLTIEGWAQKGASESFQLMVNGVVKQTLAVPNGAAFTLNWTITGLASGDVAEVEIDIAGSGFGGSGVTTNYQIYDAYVSPAPTIATSWPGLPTFAGTYNMARLNQIINASAYLYDRINAIPSLPTITQLYVHGSSVTGDVYPLWYGTVERSNGNNTLRAYIRMANFGNVSESYRIIVNGTTVYTSPTIGVGQTVETTHAIDLSSQPAGVRLPVRIEHVVTTGPVLGASGDRNSRFHISGIKMYQTAPGVGSAPDNFNSGALMASAAVDTRLNAIVALLSAAKARIDTHPRIFDRVRLMRRMYGRNENQYAVYAPNNTYVQRFVQRTGGRLIVRGKNVRIAWGALSTTAEKTVTTAYKVDFANTQDVIDGDTVQTKTIYLDTLEGLRRGMTYQIIGENVMYAAEYLV